MQDIILLDPQYLYPTARKMVQDAASHPTHTDYDRIILQRGVLQFSTCTRHGIFQFQSSMGNAARRQAPVISETVGAQYTNPIKAENFLHIRVGVTTDL